MLVLVCVCVRARLRLRLSKPRDDCESGAASVPRDDCESGAASVPRDGNTQTLLRELSIASCYCPAFIVTSPSRLHSEIVLSLSLSPSPPLASPRAPSLARDPAQGGGPLTRLRVEASLGGGSSRRSAAYCSLVRLIAAQCGLLQLLAAGARGSAGCGGARAAGAAQPTLGLIATHAAHRARLRVAAARAVGTRARRRARRARSTY